jgi:GrpB-like predicted nucleotidyltransferase (UPF0157 family)
MMQPQDQVIVVPYDSRWPQSFAIERAAITRALGPLQIRIEHIGSTAVPGLAAKPIIDIMVGVVDLADFDSKRMTLDGLDYGYVPEFEKQMPDRRFFRKPNAGIRTHHLHVVQFESAFWSRHLAFRDRLRKDPKTAAEYAKVKLSLAAKFLNDRDQYTDAKGQFIEKLLGHA